MSTINRRELLFSIPAVALAPRLFGQAAKPPIPLKGLNYFVLSVSDMKRSIDFYQGLFGMPIQARQGQNVLMRIGKGPQFMMLQPAGANPPRIVPQLGLKVDSFNADRIVGMLEQHGVTRAAAADPGLTGGAMKVRVSRRGPENILAPFSLGMTQNELAVELGTVREVVVRSLRELRESRAIASLGSGRYRVESLETLQKMF